jgi:copper transport protein
MIARTVRDRSARRRGARRAWVVLALTAFVSLVIASPAAAHLDIASTSPADGQVMRDPSSPITLTFNRAATPSGSGFTLYDAQGRTVPVESSSSTDKVTWTVRPDQPLESGQYGVSWKVAAGDAHPKTGTFTFRVAATTATPESQGATEPTQSASTGTGSHTGSDHQTTGSDPHAGMSGHAASGDDALHAALAGHGQTSRGWDLAAAIARWVSFAGALVAVGALIVVVTTLVGSEGDVRLSERVVRIAATLAAAGAVVEGVSLIWAVGGLDVPWEPAVAVLLRLAAGVALAVTLRLLARRTGGRRGHDVAALPETVSGRRVAGDRSSGRAVSAAQQLVLTPPVRVGRVRGVPVRPWAAVALCTFMLVSFVFDGHTAIIEPWPVIAAATLAHTAAAAVWVGGVVLLAVLLLVRARAGVPTGAGELAVRFSVPASASVVVVGVAGSALAMLIIEAPGDLISTTWGRILLGKLALVAVVALMGYANNRYAIPALDAWRPGTARLLRRTVAAEATVMVAVLLATAALVAAQA